jgi:hypothetical protein
MFLFIIKLLSMGLGGCVGGRAGGWGAIATGYWGLPMQSPNEVLDRVRATIINDKYSQMAAPSAKCALLARFANKRSVATSWGGIRYCTFIV